MATKSDLFSASLRLARPLQCPTFNSSFRLVSNHVSIAKPSSSLHSTNKTHKNISSQVSYTNEKQQLRHLIESGEYTQSLSLLESMCAKGYKPEESLHFDLLKGLADVPDPDGAARLVELLEANDRQDKHVYHIFISCLCKAGRVVAAFEALGRMQSRGFYPKTSPCSSIVKGLCKNGMLDVALATVEHFRAEYRCKPNLVTYASLIECAIVTRRMEEVPVLLNQMALKGLRPDNVNLPVMYGRIIHNLCKLRKVDEALEFIMHLPLKESGPDATLYIILLKLFLILGKKRDAAVVIDEMLMRLQSLERRHLRGIVGMLCENGLLQKAREMIDAAVQKFGLDADMICCNFLIEAYLDNERFDLVVELVDFMTSTQQFPSGTIYGTIISGLCHMGHTNEAIEVLDSMRYFGVAPTDVTYYRIIKGLWSNGEKKTAMKMVERMVEEGLPLSETIYNVIMCCLCKDGMVDEGLEVLRAMEANGFAVNIIPYNTILLGFCKMGRMEEAMWFFQDMLERGCELDFESYCIILRGAILAGYSAEVTALLTELNERKIFDESFVTSLKDNLLRE